MKQKKIIPFVFVIIVCVTALACNDCEDFIPHIDIADVTHVNSSTDITNILLSVDGNWTFTIESDEYLLVEFVTELVSNNTIEVYARDVNNTNATIDIYSENNISNLLGSIGPFNSSGEYGFLKVTPLIGVSESFYFIIRNGTLEFNHIHDATRALYDVNLTTGSSSVVEGENLSITAYYSTSATGGPPGDIRIGLNDTNNNVVLDNNCSSGEPFQVSAITQSLCVGCVDNNDGTITLSNPDNNEEFQLIWVLTACSDGSDLSPVNLTTYELTATSAVFDNSTGNISIYAAPELSIIFPKSGSEYNYNDLFIRINITGNSVDSCWYDFNNGGNTTFNCSNEPSITAVDGVNNLTVYMNSSSGVEDFESISFSVNSSISLTISITSPANGTIRNDVSPELKLLAYDLENSSINYNLTIYYTNDTLYSSGNNGTLTNNSEESITLDPSLTLIGDLTEYKIIVNATDGINNATSSALFYTLTVPAIELLTPDNNFWDSDGNVSFSFTVEDAAFSNVSCSLVLDGVINQTNQTVLTGSTVAWFNVSSISEGENKTWQINCTDSANNSGSATRYYNVDTTSPVINSINDSNVSIFIWDVLNITVNVYDNFGIDYILINFNGSSYYMYHAYGDIYFRDFNVSDFNGIYNYTITAYDNAANTAYSGVNNVSIDTASPTVTLNSPIVDYYNDSSYLHTVSFNCSASDGFNLSNISLYLTDNQNLSFFLNQTSSVSGVSNSSVWNVNLIRGNYTWNCLAYDSAGRYDFGDNNRTIKINFSADPTAFYARAFNTSSFTLSSNEYVVGSVFNFNTSKTFTEIVLMDTFNLVKTFGAGTNEVWLNVTVDGGQVFEGKVGTVSRAGSSLTEVSSGIGPVLFNVSSGEHNITFYHKIVGGGTVELNDEDLSLLILESFHNDSVFLDINSGTVTFNNTNLSEVSSFELNKGVVSSSSFGGVFRLNASSATDVFCRYKFSDTNTSSFFFARSLSDSSDVGSAGLGAKQNFNGTTSNVSLECYSSTGADVTIEWDTMSFDLADNSTRNISSYGASNSSSNLTNTIILDSGTHSLVNFSYAPKSSLDSLYISGSVSLKSVSGLQDPTIFINSSLSNCYSKRERTLTDSDVYGNIFFVVVCDDISFGNTYNFSLEVSVSAGESVEIVDEHLSVIEANSFDITETNTPPSVALTNPLNSTTVSGSVAISWANVDQQGDSFITNLTLSNSTTTIVLASNLSSSITSYVWNSIPFLDDNWTLGIVSCENETGDFLCRNDSHVIVTSNHFVTNFTLVDFSNESIPGSCSVVHSNGTVLHVDDDVSVVNQLDYGVYNITLKPSDSIMSQIFIESLNLTDDCTSFFTVEDLADNKNYSELYVIDPSGFDFTNATITINQTQGNTLYKCVNWNSTNESCGLVCDDDGNETDCHEDWEYVQVLSGGAYNISINATDPAFAETSEAIDLSIAPINQSVFVIAWIDNTDQDLSFRVMYTNGTVLVDTVDVDTTVDTASRVSVSAINSTHFALGWIDGPDDDATRAIYTVAGTQVLAPTDVDTDVGLYTDVSLGQMGDRFAFCYMNDQDNDADLKIYNNAGTELVGETAVDSNAAPAATLQNLVACVAINSTRWAYLWFDDLSNDISCEIYDEVATPLELMDIDADAGELAQVDVVGLDNNKIATVYYDNTDQDITITLRYLNGTDILLPTDIDTTAGTESRVAITAFKASLSAVNDSFAVVWWDQASSDIKAATYSNTGTQIAAPFTVDAQQNTNYRLLDVAGYDSITGNGICNGTFVVAYSNTSNQGTFNVYNADGSAWDGICIDTIPPNVTLVNPKNITYNTTVNISLDYTLVEAHPDSCFYSLNGAVNVTISNCLNTTINVSVGQNTLILYANDTAGQLDSDSVSFFAYGNTSLNVTDSKDPVEVLEEFVLHANYSYSHNATPILNASCSIQGDLGIFEDGRMIYFDEDFGSEPNSTEAIYGNNSRRYDFNNVLEGGVRYHPLIKYHKKGNPADNLYVYVRCDGNNTIDDTYLIGNETAADSASEGNWTFSIIDFSNISSPNCSIFVTSPNSTDYNNSYHILKSNITGTGTFYSTDYGDTWQASTLLDVVDFGHIWNTSPLYYNDTSKLYELEYEIHVDSVGIHSFNVTCNKTNYFNRSEVETVTAQDNAIPFVEISRVDPNPSRYNEENVTIEWVADDFTLDYSVINVTYPNGTLLVQNVVSPIILNTTQLSELGNYTVYAWANDSAGLVSNSTVILEVIQGCIYVTGNWDINCSYGCSIDSNIDLGGNNITITGTGTFTTTANITNFTDLFIQGTDSVNRCEVYCNDGGCFQS